MLYKLIRTRRRTLALHITPQGLEARAPLSMPLEEIERFIDSKSDWLEKNMPENAWQYDGRGGFLPGYGDEIPFRGRRCPILGSSDLNPVRPGEIHGRYVDGAFHISENLSPDEIRLILSSILKQEAREYIPGRVAYYQMKMKLKPESVKITTAFRRWGSCSGKKRLHFAWMLMMADDEAIDSIVVHELAHMVFANHSHSFYGLVRAFFPSYDLAHKRLDALGRQIDREGWRG